MSKNYHNYVVDELREAGYKMLRRSSRGDLYAKTGKPLVAVPVRITTRQKANNMIYGYLWVFAGVFLGGICQKLPIIFMT